MAEDDTKQVLDSALSDEVIDEEQYVEILKRFEQKEEKEGRGRIQSVLIYTGIIVLIIAVIITILITFSEISYEERLATLSLITVMVFASGMYAKKKDLTDFYYGLLSGTSNLIVLTYGYWFVYDPKAVVLAFPLVVVPIASLSYFINENSRLSSQGALLSLIIGSFFLYIRLMIWGFSFKTGYWGLGIIGLSFLIFSIMVNILWIKDFLKEWEGFYEKRIETFHSLISSGYVLGSIYIWFYPVILYSPYDNTFSIGALYVMVLAFFVLVYSIKTKKDGLIYSSCGMIIVSIWFAFLPDGGFFVILVLGILTAFILIGMAWFLRKFSVLD
ncbi:MAG: DUF2157 domain-containing protein [Candidatus Saliniplasma sp.]